MHSFMHDSTGGRDRIENVRAGWTINLYYIKLILLWNEQAGHPAAKHSEKLRQERRVVLASPPSEAALTAAVGGSTCGKCGK